MTESPLGGLAVDPDLDRWLSAQLSAVEDLLLESVSSDDRFVNEPSGHLVQAGGKRFRPLLTTLASQFGPRPGAPEVLKAAVVVELTHLATLYHDDVMDEAELRRGALSANARWDNSVAILTGDFLFARASLILADLGTDAVRLQAQTFERLCTGQIRESVGPDAGADPVKHHLQVLSEKTGSLISTAGKFGTMMAGAEADTVEVMGQFGEAIGVAFQLADDIVDVMSDSDQSGKSPGTDLREGVPTLATLLARESKNPADADLIRLLSGPIIDDDEHEWALATLRQHPAMEAAREEARSWAADARRWLSPLPDGASREALAALCDYVVNRTG